MRPFQVNNLGTWSNSAIYASLLPSCLFLPSILIKKLKVKWTLVVCIFCYTTYIAAQFYPEFYTLLPTAFILGMGAAPMWSAKCTYLTQVAHRFAGLDGSDPEPVVVKFFGIFFFFFQCNSILGNIISTTGRENTSHISSGCRLNLLFQFFPLGTRMNIFRQMMMKWLQSVALPTAQHSWDLPQTSLNIMNWLQCLLQTQCISKVIISRLT